MATEIWVNVVSGNGLLPGVINDDLWQFRKKRSRYQLLRWVWKLLIQNSFSLIDLTAHEDSLNCSHFQWDPLHVIRVSHTMGYVSAYCCSKIGSIPNTVKNYGPVIPVLNANAVCNVQLYMTIMKNKWFNRLHNFVVKIHTVHIFYFDGSKSTKNTVFKWIYIYIYIRM